MNKTQIFISYLKKLVLAAAAFVFIVACSQEEDILVQEVSSAATPEVVEEVAEDAEVASVTLSGVHTIMVAAVSCSTCTFVVADNVNHVDGAALGIKAGSVVCIGKGRRLGEIEFENMIGTESEPITIGTCAN